MGDKKSPTRPKRQPKPSSDEGYWDCSVCTFRNSAEAFKCLMCDVRKGTSTRKPRPVSQLVAQQVPQQFVPPTQSKKEKKDKVEKEKSEKETTSKKNSHKKTSDADLQFFLRCFSHAVSASGEHDVKAYLSSSGGKAGVVSAEVNGNQFYFKQSQMIA
ncbi:YY1-associated factor 2 isoform X2 [Aphelocoma coerulescens]|uniref:YY1-associated factor 2 isoform X2 n=1 Tax=Aphelocoma coerulescens TaxID=39617 RepID=UPI0036050A24